MATQEQIDQVINSTDMVDLVSPYVKLIKQGKNYKGVCPFHNEDTPSFVVSQEKHLAHCFGCGKGGTPIQFLMEIKRISFNEALAELAQKNGIKIDVNFKSNKDEVNPKYYEMMELATKLYQKNLVTTKSGKEALAYLEKRGLNKEIINEFRIGLAPANTDTLYQVLKEANFLELDMMDLGLIGRNDKGYYDLFVKRIMFPILDEQSKPIGFSGRIFNNEDKNQPKYVNTRDTFLYHKGSVLFHLDKAKAEILRKKRVILHEGQMDVIAAYKAGYKEAICTMGTALTIQQANVLKRYASEAIICYDGDKAGIEASKKAIRIFKQAKILPKLVLLPNGLDPDEYIMQNGIAAYQEYFEENILDEYEYLFEVIFRNQDLTNLALVEQLKQEAFQFISKLPSSTIKEKYLVEIAKKINSSKEAVKEDYETKYKANPFDDYIYDDYYEEQPISKPKPIKNNLKRQYEARLFMYARRSKKDALEIDSKLGEAILAFSPINRLIWSTLIDNYYMQYEEFDDSAFCALLGEEEKDVYLTNLESLRGSIEVYNEQDLKLIIEKMKKVAVEVKNRELSEAISNSYDLSYQLKLTSEKFKNKRPRRK